MIRSLNSGHVGITSLHALYVTLTGHDLALNFDRERSWQEWMNRGNVEADLILVAKYRKKFIQTGERHPASLLFRNLIVDLDKFEEDKSFYRALDRKKPTMNAARAQVLLDTGRRTEPPDSVKTPAIIGKTPDEMKAFFDKCKREAGL